MILPGAGFSSHGRLLNLGGGGRGGGGIPKKIASLEFGVPSWKLESSWVVQRESQKGREKMVNPKSEQQFKTVEYVNSES